MHTTEPISDVSRLSTLEHFVGDSQAFLAKHWNRTPYLHRSGEAHRFQRYLSVQDLDDILAHRALREPYIRLTRDGRPIHADRYMKPWRVQGAPLRGITDVDRLAAEFTAGATIVLDSIDHYHKPIEELCSALSAEIGSFAEAVAFLTPPSVQGLTRHYDDIEVFVLQVHGTKRWRVYDQIRPLVSAGKVIGGEDEPPMLEAVLEPGDCLYIPWGSPHYATSENSFSCHVSVMVRPSTWHDVVWSLVRSLTDTNVYRPVPSMQEPLRPGAIAEGLAYWQQLVRALGDQDLAAYLTRFKAEQVRRKPSRTGFLRQVAARVSLTPMSRVSRELETSCTVRELPDGRQELTVGNRRFRLPGAAKDLLAKLDGLKDAQVKDLPGNLPESSLVEVVALLINNGALHVEDGSPATFEGGQS